MAPLKKLPRRLRAFRPRFIGGNRLQRFESGEAAFEAMLGAIDGASFQVLLEMYWFAADAIGQRFFEALGRAAERSVEVAVLYDSLGSLGTDSSSFHELTQRGASVIEYNPLLPWHRRFRLTEFTRRDHRKVLVVDGEVGFTGGLNIGDEWMPVQQGGSGWKDECLQMRGPAVAGFIESFFHVWREEGGPRLQDLRRRAVASGDEQALVIGQAGPRESREITSTYLWQLWHARKRIWLTNSYFVPDGRIVRALVAAVRRGVDVRVLLPGISDVETVRHASRGVWSKLLRRGVRIFEWHTSVLHAKTAVVDGAWATVGTFNLDYRSIRHNLEINVSIQGRAFAEDMEHSFLRDLDSAREVELKDLVFRSLGDRLLEMVLYRLRFLL